LKLLITMGGNLWEKDINGNTPLVLAQHAGDTHWPPQQARAA
jgi:hypothetical protein